MLSFVMNNGIFFTNVFFHRPFFYRYYTSLLAKVGVYFLLAKFCSLEQRMHLCGKMDKIRYRLVYNRQNTLNRQGTALVQVEAYLNQRKVYFKTNVYLKPECWSKDGAQVINHPQSQELNAMLYEHILELQAIELSYWKRGLESNLSTLKEAVRKGVKPVVSFLKFAQQVIVNSDRKPGTKDNMLGTVATLKEFRNVIEFTDINYTFLKEFDAFLRNKGLKVNTVGKHMRILRTLVNEAINEGYILQEAYPFRKFKIKREKKEHNFLMPADLEKLENLKLPDRKNNSRHILDAFLFCCYCGLRFSDFKQLTCKNLVTVDGKEWLVLNSVKTGVKLNIPLYLLFNGKALGIMRKYDSIEQLAALGCNSDTNRTLQKLGRMAHIGKKFTYHTSRHTCATLLVHQGVPITTVQKLLGHTSVKTTEIYSEVFDETIIKDLTRANQIYSKRRNVKQNQIKSQKSPGKYLRQ